MSENPLAQELREELEKCRQESTLLERELSVLTEKTEIMKVASLILTNDAENLSMVTTEGEWEKGVVDVVIRFTIKP
jgi:hypothetical protein